MHNERTRKSEVGAHHIFLWALLRKQHVTYKNYLQKFSQLLHVRVLEASFKFDSIVEENERTQTDERTDGQADR